MTQFDMRKGRIILTSEAWQMIFYGPAENALSVFRNVWIRDRENDGDYITLKCTSPLFDRISEGELLPLYTIDDNGRVMREGESNWREPIAHAAPTDPNGLT